MLEAIGRALTGRINGNNQRGDNYTLLTVLFALVLFLTAISQRELATWARRVLRGCPALGIAGVIIMLTFPIKN